MVKANSSKIGSQKMLKNQFFLANKQNRLAVASILMLAAIGVFELSSYSGYSYFLVVELANILISILAIIMAAASFERNLGRTFAAIVIILISLMEITYIAWVIYFTSQFQF